MDSLAAAIATGYLIAGATAMIFAKWDMSAAFYAAAAMWWAIACYFKDSK